MKFYKFLKSLFIKPKPIHICKYNVINFTTKISGSKLYKGKYKWCEDCNFQDCSELPNVDING